MALRRERETGCPASPVAGRGPVEGRDGSDFRRAGAEWVLDRRDVQDGRRRARGVRDRASRRRPRGAGDPCHGSQGHRHDHAELLDLTARVRGGSLRSSELSDPRITVTNLGELGVEEAFAVIYPPQVAIVAFGRVMSRPGVVDGRVEARTVLTATTSADHRAVDGRRAGQFLAAVDRRLQAPEQL